MGEMNFTTKVKIEPSDFKISYKNNILLLGSCFSDEIGALLKDYRFNVLCNPFGTLYNPISIENSIKRLLSGRKFTEEDVIQTNPTNPQSPKLYASFYHHSSFARTCKKDFLENANKSLKEASEFLKKADTIIITLGTAWVYRHIKKGIIVSNCHKILATEFKRELLNTHNCSQSIQNIINLLPDKKIIFTVSPIRHFKDGAHGNQISKSTLLLSINNAIENTLQSSALCTSQTEIHNALQSSALCNPAYFPSYEIMMDELRDYRFYSEDMLHPSSVAVQYIFNCFKETFISPSAYQQMAENLKISKREKHREFHR